MEKQLDGEVVAERVLSNSGVLRHEADDRSYHEIAASLGLIVTSACTKLPPVGAKF